MSDVHLTKFTYGGSSVFKVGSKFYAINSRHNTHVAAEKSPAYKDSFYLGKTRSRIVKYGRYYLVLQPVRVKTDSRGQLVKV